MDANLPPQNPLHLSRSSVLSHPRVEHVLTALVLASMGSAIAAGFVADVELPLKPAVLLFSCLVLWGIRSQCVSPFSLLPRLCIVLYSACFSVTLGHLFSDEFLWWHTPAAVALIRDQQTSADMMAVGTVGLLGLLSGVRVAQGVLAVRGVERRDSAGSLGSWAFLAITGIAVFLSWLVAPRETILTSAYNTGGAASVAAPMNFNAAFLLSYVVIVLLFVDAEQDVARHRQHVKFWLLAAATTYVVIVLQVFRGDRESVSLLVGLALLYLTGVDSTALAQRVSQSLRRMRRLIVPATVLLVIFLALGVARLSLASAEGRVGFSVGDALSQALQHNTWTSVLLTNVAQAGQFRAGTAEYLYGQTYWYYLLSLPPGMITRALGIERPLESDRGPNWWFAGISAGGIHIVLVPFRNFGMPGAFLILTGIGVFIGYVEMANRHASFSGRFLYGAVAVGAFFWFWYGDMYMIRTLMSVALLGPLYAAWVRFGREWILATIVGHGARG